MVNIPIDYSSKINTPDSILQNITKEPNLVNKGYSGNTLVNYLHTQNASLNTAIFGTAIDERLTQKDRLAQGYTPFNLNLEQETPEKKPAYDSIELLAHQILATQHAYHGLQSANNSASYIAGNDKYTISASEGYIGNNLGYLTLSISKQKEELQNYTIMLKYTDGKSREVQQDDTISKGIDELLEQLTEKDKLETEDILQMLQKILTERKDTEENLALSNSELNLLKKSMKETIKVEQHDKLKSVILMLETEKNIRLKELLIRKNPEKDEKNEQNLHDEPKKEIIYTYAPSYLATIADYIKKLEKRRNDFTNLAPFKVVHKFPVNLMGGVLGFTYLGENFMGIRDDLYGQGLYEVELHESIHTPDEYETRVITKWMLDNETRYH